MPSVGASRFRGRTGAAVASAAAAMPGGQSCQRHRRDGERERVEPERGRGAGPMTSAPPMAGRPESPAASRSTPARCRPGGRRRTAARDDRERSGQEQSLTGPDHDRDRHQHDRPGRTVRRRHREGGEGQRADHVGRPHHRLRPPPVAGPPADRDQRGPRHPVGGQHGAEQQHAAVRGEHVPGQRDRVAGSPTLEVTWPIVSSRNPRWRSGASARRAVSLGIAGIALARRQGDRVGQITPPPAARRPGAWTGFQPALGGPPHQQFVHLVAELPSSAGVR